MDKKDNLTNIVSFKFQEKKCPSCKKVGKVMFSNNPLSAETICFDCINAQLDYNNLQHADFFCRTYNLPFNPDKWIEISQEYEKDTFEVYTEFMITKFNEEEKKNLYYSGTTADLWALANKE